MKVSLQSPSYASSFAKASADKKASGGQAAGSRQSPPIRHLSSVVILLLIGILSSCGTDSDDVVIPKPSAYFRIDLPEKKYEVLRDSCPFEFEYPSNYSLVVPDPDKNAEPCWKNIAYPQFYAEINLSYKPISTAHPLEKYLEDSWTLATRHQVRASGMPETPIRRDSAKVYGLLFEIEGNSASNLQFYVTDSTHHFVRGALYFFARPNYDSLSPVIDFLKKDVERMIISWKWKDQAPIQPYEEVKVDVRH